MLINNELADGCYKLVCGLYNNNISISSLALKIVCKVNKALVEK